MFISKVPTLGNQVLISETGRTGAAPRIFSYAWENAGLNKKDHKTFNLVWEMLLNTPEQPAEVQEDSHGHQHCNKGHGIFSLVQEDIHGNDPGSCSTPRFCYLPSILEILLSHLLFLFLCWCPCSRAPVWVTVVDEAGDVGSLVNRALTEWTTLGGITLFIFDGGRNIYRVYALGKIGSVLC